MEKNVERLLAMLNSEDCYDHSAESLQEAQIAALNERLQGRLERIRLVEFRARDAEVSTITRLEDVVPLLLPHTAYKSYPESFLSGGKWDKLTKWLATVSSYPTDGVDLTDLETIDQWVEACGKAGLFVSCSSGTTGKSAMLVASRADLDFLTRDSIHAVQWGSNMRAGDMRTPAGPASAVAYTPRNAATGQAMLRAFVDPSALRFESGLPPVTVGALTGMVVLRKAIADGTAKPDEVAAFEAESAARQAALDAAQAGAVEDIISKRGQRLYITGMWGSLYALAKAVRERGFSGSDFHPENGLYVGGGLKRAQLPDNYREFIYETFNLHPGYTYHMYGMQELNSAMPRCEAGQRYHVPPWVVVLPLNKEGDTLIERRGEVECRAAFFDLSLDGRWGGVISGDRIHVDFSPCACGAKSPSIRDDIARYSDLEGDDKIGCAGTVDAYVRGLS
ncbi:hypothetical protein ABVV53_12315 [Novosphingobium sp. RD2P27]|uniref:Acyl-protein synthetase LuxE domain-containing protein n=1 Tax=Novosphingobium kalidii TaxID=3230299 RepID=A0ABV2D2Y1_9SPHN